jgi:hypothetical protein
MNDLKIVPMGSAVQVRASDGRVLTTEPTDAEARAWVAGWVAGNLYVRRDLHDVLERIGVGRP